ncbi:unnamed protein product [Rhizophagus irregularis]|nr:unnamed protein product [Rhizophagus irregularis]
MNREETQLRNPKWKILTCIISGHGTKIKAFQKTINLHRLQTWISWYAERSLDPTTCAYKIRMRILVDMLSEGFAYNTIAGYRTAVSEIHETCRRVFDRNTPRCRKNGAIYSHR